MTQNFSQNPPSSEPQALTHLDSEGQAQMVDVSAKVQAVRHAVAAGAGANASYYVCYYSSWQRS